MPINRFSVTIPVVKYIVLERDTQRTEKMFFINGNNISASALSRYFFHYSQFLYAIDGEPRQSNRYDLQNF